jgi:hypothetical protein
VDLLDALLTFLADEAGIVRRPDAAGPLHPLWRAPVDGPPAPGEATGSGNDPVLILSCFETNEVPRSTDRAFSDQRIVDVRIRSMNRPEASRVHAEILAELAPPPLAIRTDWTMGGLYLIASQQWRGLQPIASDRAQGWDLTSAYLFETPVAGA